ncbi:MAG: bifunctional phosphoribosylaminoimidazolecarboxamide formyltransferase/IMP cyclohydrolase [Thermoanaerobaculia bacterium]|nr:bifunctional phosphoribosylaminoimidazolecarboxamide formyltransferase/IMP cyclohydrolase [Thermoanaerobaculia bacterium]
MTQHVERALLSVSDKTGITELAQFLASRGVEILSTGGTADHLSRAGINVVKVSDFTGAPEILGGRVKTLHPKIFAGILADRSKPAHQKDCEEHGLPRIDLVVVNLYPFEATVAKEGVTVPEAIEQIDVGGPSMLRAAAKNHKQSIPLSDPSLYGEFMKEMESGTISDAFRFRAAVTTFARTAAYDLAISSWLSRQIDGEAAPLGERFGISMQRVQSLRYGENPKQFAALYAPGGKAPFRQLHGKELSFNNIIDLEAAWRLASEFVGPAGVVIKHTNPCGVGTANTIAGALRNAIAADPVSAFGGIIGVNRPFDDACAEAVGALFLEVIVAPSFSEGAKEILGRKKNLRLVETDGLRQSLDIRTAAGGILVQTSDVVAPATDWKVVTKLQADESTMRGLEFAWIVCSHVKSNAIVIAREAQTVGIGAGQMSRVDSAKLAVTKAMSPTAGCVAASDAFFPFRDGLDILADAGIRAVVQPGGSVRDDEVIAAADERGIVMVFTGERHFRH